MMTKTDANDSDWVERAQAGGATAFDKLVTAHHGMVYGIAWSHLKQREAAEDLAQEVFVRAWLKIDTLKDSRLFGAWVARMTRNLALNWKRDNVRRSRLVQMVSSTTEEGAIDFSHSGTAAGEALAAPQLSARDQVAANQEEKAMKDALDILSNEDRELVTLHYMGELSHRQIAERLGIHHTTVSRRLGRALADLRGTMEGAMNPPAPASNAVVSTCSAVAVVAAISGAKKAAVIATAESTAAGVNLAVPGSTLVGSLMASPAIQALGVLTGLQKALIIFLLLIVSSAPFIYMAAHQSGYFSPGPLEDANITRVVQADFFGDYSVDIMTGEVVEMRFATPNFLDVSRNVITEQEPGVMSGYVYRTDGGRDFFRWDCSLPFEEVPNFTNVQIWQARNRVFVRTLDVEQIDGGMRIHYFSVNRPEYLSELKRLEYRYESGQISKMVLQENQLRIFEEGGLLPNRLNNRRRVKDMIIHFTYEGE